MMVSPDPQDDDGTSTARLLPAEQKQIEVIPSADIDLRLPPPSVPENVAPLSKEAEAERLASSLKHVAEKAERKMAVHRERVALVMDSGETMRQLRAMRRELQQQVQRERRAESQL